MRNGAYMWWMIAYIGRNQIRLSSIPGKKAPVF